LSDGEKFKKALDDSSGPSVDDEPPSVEGPSGEVPSGDGHVAEVSVELSAGSSRIVAHTISGDSLDEETAVSAGARIREAEHIQPGFVLAQRYQIEAALGDGGSGTVYRAWDRILGNLVAVKILHAQRAREKSWIKRLAREVKVARAVGHPNVCRVFELGHAEGHWFVTMELATHGSLRDMLRSPDQVRSRPLPERLRNIREVCAGLAAMHAVAIIHRDVTPQNVLGMADGRLVLTDFGLAIESGDQTTVHGGTPAYLPPEVARGERSDQRSDVFQLGMIMHEVLTGVRPSWAPDGSRLILAEPSTGASPVEEELVRLISDCVNTDPGQRPPSAVAVAGRVAAAEVARPAPVVFRMATRARRFVRKHKHLMWAAAGAVVVVGLVKTAQVASRPALCRGAAQQLAGIWDGPRSAAVQLAFAKSGKTYAQETFDRVRTILDQYGVAWAGMYTDACEATNLRGEQSGEVLDLRMACLKDEQGELRALVDLFSSAQGEVVSRSIGAASALAPVSRCAEVRVLRAVVRPPDDRQTRARVEDLRQRLSEVKALYGSGRLVEASRRSRPLVAEARAIGYEPLLAEALAVLGRAEYLLKPNAEAESVLDEAMLVAEGSRHDRVLAEAAVDVVNMMGVIGNLEKLNQFVPRAEATLKRIGGDQRLQSWIYAALGQALNLNGRYAEALTMHQKELQTKLSVLPATHWDVALSIGNIANCLQSLGRNDEALAQNERAIAILEKALGREHPDLALHVYNRGEIRLALGHIPEARADFERSLGIWKEELPPDHLYNSFPLTGLGLSRLAEGGSAVAAAIEPLERALAIRDHAGAAPEMRAQTMFALARALWRAGPERERPRAQRLAEEARRLFPANKTAERLQVSEALADWQQSDGRDEGHDHDATSRHKARP